MIRMREIYRCHRISILVVAGFLTLAVLLFLGRTGPAREPTRLPLWAASVSTQSFMTVYFPAQANGTTVVICPGGGYGELVMESEGRQTAQWLASHGFTGVILEYRLPHGNPAIPLLDAQRAIRMVRSKATEWNCDPHQIGIMGFSAGGHLAAMASTRFDGGDPQAADPVSRMSSRPDFSILIYPVISMGPVADAGSRLNLLGEVPSPEAIKVYSAEQQVTAQTPPAFLVHARDDPIVSPENSQLYAAALQAHDIPAEYLELPAGGHGLGYGGPLWNLWQTRALRWLAQQKLISSAP